MHPRGWNKSKSWKAMRDEAREITGSQNTQATLCHYKGLVFYFPERDRKVFLSTVLHFGRKLNPNLRLKIKSKYSVEQHISLYTCLNCKSLLTNEEERRLKLAPNLK